MAVNYSDLRIVWSRSMGDMKDEQGNYALPSGQFPSVTRILEGHKDFLWVHLAKIASYVGELALAYNQGEDVEIWAGADGEYQRAMVPALAVLQDGAHVSKAGLRYMKQAADRGQGVHFLFEAWGQGIRPEVGEARELAEWAVVENNWKANQEELASYMVSAIRWLDFYQPEFIYPELVLCDPLRGYAGRCDARIAVIEGRQCIPDVKTHDQMKRLWIAQIAAYRGCPYGYQKGERGATLVEIEPEWKQLPGCSIMSTPEKTGHRFIDPALMDFYYLKFLSQLDAYMGLTKGPLPGRAKWIKNK